MSCFALCATDTDSVQMLQRSTQVGEFYRMAAPKVKDPQGGLSAQYMGEQLHNRRLGLSSAHLI